MSLRALPEIKAFDAGRGLTDAPADAIERWTPGVRAAVQGDDTISILDVIGDDGFGGVSARRIAAALRQNAGKPVTVQVNSPGGDFFEGVAIYNMLREHSAKVTVHVIGLAASAASVIAMAGDEIAVSKAGSIMIHNAWAVAIGDQHDMREIADALAGFDEAMVRVYSDRTSIDGDELAKMMAAETWLQGPDAVKRGFADSFLPSDAITEDNDAKGGKSKALRRVDTALARQGIPRNERRALLREIGTDTPGAVDPAATPCAGVTESFLKLAQTISAKEISS